MNPRTLDDVMRIWMSSRVIPTLNHPNTEHLHHLYKWVIKIGPEGGVGIGSDSYIEWATQELKKWSGVTRLSWDMWSFPSRRDAEKFQTLYYLTWPQ